MSATIFLILCGIAFCWLLYQEAKSKSMQRQPTSNAQIHQRQQDALKRYHDQRKRDIDDYWKSRGKVIKPLDKTRYGAWVDETKEIS